MNLYGFLTPLIHLLPEETAHNMAISLMKTGLFPNQKKALYSALLQDLWDIKFENPIGLAAGFDKNAEVIASLLSQGFGFVEVGTVTPLSQAGNPKPRLFRLKEDRAIINKMGFNNKGIIEYRDNISKWFESGKDGIVGANIGKNKDSANNSSDYITSMQEIYPFCSYITINISSPNTPNLRKLQQYDVLSTFLLDIMNERNKLADKYDQKPILVKISPDEDENAMKDIAKLLIEHKVDGVIVSNTTVSLRDKLKSKNVISEGGLSGEPLFELSTQKLKTIYRLTEGKIPIIGVGGISSGKTAYQKIRAGASLIQIYSALIYEGFGLVNRINAELDELLKQDGFSNISEVIGIDAH